jgi:prolipoprotein diacylglyceryltransferase
LQVASTYNAIAWTDLHLSPVALHLGYFDLRWYSLAYLAGIFVGYWYLLKLLKQPGAPMARRHADDLVFYAALGIIFGGRIGYVLFYNLSEYLQHPIDILRLWDGGMSFHGGVIGTSLGILYLARKEKLPWLRLHDYVACCVPFGLFFGRLANFVNHELWGAPTNVPWAVRFPEVINGITVLGPPESSERRLNLAQSFNGFGAWVTPKIGKLFILTAVAYTATQIKSMSPAQFRAFQLSEASTVKIPYLVITGLLLFVAALIHFSHLPDVRERSAEAKQAPPKDELRQAFRQRHLVLGTLAQFFYVGAQVGVTSFVIRFAQHSLGLSSRDGSDYLGWHLFGFMIGRILGSLMMQKVSPTKLLALFAGGSAICGVIAISMTGTVSVWAVVAIRSSTTAGSPSSRLSTSSRVCEPDRNGSVSSK